MHSAAPASASRRSAIGTVPAWPAMPVSSCRQPRGARDRRHHADRKTLLFQHRPLLDVQFDIGKQFAARACGRADMVGIEAECLTIASRMEMPARSRVLSTLSSKVPATARLPSSVEAKRTPSSSANPTTSIANGNRLPAVVQIGNAGDRGDQSERPIPFAGIAHGVVMRAQHQARQAGPIAFVSAADIADRVEMRAHAGLAHPDENEIGGGAVFGRKENPRQMLRRFGNGRELLDPADDLIGKR